MPVEVTSLTHVGTTLKAMGVRHEHSEPYYVDGIRVLSQDYGSSSLCHDSSRLELAEL